MPRRARATRGRKRRAPRRGRKTGRKTGIPRSLGLGNQMARIVETIEFNRLNANYVQGMAFNIGQFERARTLATNFRWYKATKVTWTIEPQFNTYQSSASGATVPYLYQIMNRTADFSYITLSDMLTQGARPVKLTATKKLSYRPNWCSPGLLVQNVTQSPGFGGVLNNVFVQGLKAEYGWLQAPNLLGPGPGGALGGITPIVALDGTNGNTAVKNQASYTYYQGHQLYVDQVVGPSAPVSLYKVTCQVHWSFKDPKNTLAGVTDNIFGDISGVIVPPEDDIE